MHNDKAGFIILISLFFASTLALLVSVGIGRSFTELLASRTYVSTNQAFHLAEAGLDEAIWEFSNSNGDFKNIEGWNDAGPLLHCPPNCSKDLQLTPDHAQTTTVVANGTTLMHPEVISSSPIANTNQEVKLRIILDRRADDAIGLGAFADGFFQVVAEHGIIDNYDSRKGPYNDNPASPNFNKSFTATIGTNGVVDRAPNGEFHIANRSISFDIDGTAYIAPGKDVGIPDPYIGGEYFEWEEMQDSRTLPTVRFPNRNYYGAMLGDLKVGSGEEEICEEPRRYNTLQVTGNGRFVMEQGCQLYIDYDPNYIKPNGTKTKVTPNNSMNTNDSGRFIVDANVVTPVKVFIREGGFDLDGRGVENETTTPEKFQLYVVGEHGRLRQTSDFYGTVYVARKGVETDENGEDVVFEPSNPNHGTLELGRASENGISYNSTYHGLFFAGMALNVTDHGDPFRVNVHLDEALKWLVMDGSGRMAKPDIVFWNNE